MKRLTTLLLPISLLLSNVFPAQAQIMADELELKHIKAPNTYNITNTLPNVIGWADDDNYLISRRNIGDNQAYTFKVNAKRGIETPYTTTQRNTTGVKVKDGDIYYVLSIGATEIRLTNTQEEEKVPMLSPDNKWVAFVRNNNLYIINIDTKKETQCTTDGSETILNGYASWVYYEEILGRATQYRAFWWSPDSKYIAFMNSDESKVPVFPIYNSEGQHGFLELTRYPKAGDPNPDVKIGVYSLNNQKTTWTDFDPKDDQYFGRPFWTPKGDALFVQWMNRGQDNLKIYAVAPETGNKQEIYDEKQSTWIDWKDDLYFLPNNKGFIVCNDTDGWAQLYRYAMDGQYIGQLTQGNNWETNIVAYDAKTDYLYYTSRAELSTRIDFYRVKIDGKNQKRLTFGDYTHSVYLSPNAKYFISRYSNINTPTRIGIFDVETSKEIAEIGNAKGKEFNNYKLTKTEVIWITTPDGFKLPATLTYPTNLNPSVKYPVLISIYGGPNAGTVKDTWGGIGMKEWWAKEGLIQISIDHRGSGHCGKKGLNYLHRNLGKWEMEDYTQWVKWLGEKPFVDKNRIGITGGSYGGYISALALTKGADYFTHGLALFGVMDWALYDSHYTERYMDTPQENPDGYKAASVMTYAEKYNPNGQSMLRIVHGTMDDNVHMQNSIQLISTLEDLNKEFEFMLYPGSRHGIGGQKAAHSRADTYRFIYHHLLNRPVNELLIK